MGFPAAAATARLSGVEALHAALRQMEPISLDATRAVALMDRVDTRYMLPAVEVAGILAASADTYRVLHIDGHRLCRYSTLYFDTADLLFYHRHHNGRLNRHKVRIRTYEDSAASFLEVKLKNNHGRTLKSRVSVASRSVIELERLHDSAFDAVAPPLPPELLQPTLRVEYLRITLANRTAPERVTIDLMLRFARGGAAAAFPAAAIIEVKQQRRCVTPLRELMARLHVREGGISKYCLGVATLCLGTRTNRFKPAIRRMHGFR